MHISLERLQELRLLLEKHLGKEYADQLDESDLRKVGELLMTVLALYRKVEQRKRCTD